MKKNIKGTFKIFISICYEEDFYELYMDNIEPDKLYDIVRHLLINPEFVKMKIEENYE